MLAPKWVGSLGMSYETDITDALVLGLSVDGRYSGRYLASPFGNPIDSQNSYAVLDASASITTSDKRWSLALIGKNLTNKFYITGAQDAPTTGGGTGTAGGFMADQMGLAALPRTIMAQITFKY